MAVPKIMLILTENWTLLGNHELRKLVDWAVIAEQAGVDGVMLSDHITLGASSGSNGVMENPRAYAVPGNIDPMTPWPSSMLLMSAIAARTTKLRIFAGAIIAPLRHPVLLAHQLATLDILAEGRFIVQPTVSWHRDEYGHLGVPFNQRGKLLDEHLAIWKLLWRESPASYEGVFYQFEDLYMEPKPYTPGGPKMWFGGQSVHEAILRRLAQYGSGFHPLGQPSDEDIEKLEAAMSAAGRDYASLEKIGGIRAVFRDNDSPSTLAAALPSIPPQLEAGFTTICVKPNQFIDDPDAFEDFCYELVEAFNTMEVPA